MTWYYDWLNSKEFGDLLRGETYPIQDIDNKPKERKMKTTEEMMCEWMQSQLDENQTFTINSEQYLKIWNWFQSVELAQEKAEYMTRYNKRVDGNHHEIVQGLRDCGYIVKDTSKYGDGFPDCIVRGGGRVVMLEIKQGSAKLTDAEKEFHQTFGGLGCYIVRTLEQALDVMKRESV